jgi:hypothetical protein
MTILTALPLIAAATGLPAVGAQPSDLARVCDFDSACIERRPCFDSTLRVRVAPVAGAADLARIDFGDGRVRLARVSHSGVWTSLVTEPDIDHANRVEVLDFADNGRATLVVNDPGTAVSLISRTGTCRPDDGDPT